jgi:hypothetical protein
LHEWFDRQRKHSVGNKSGVCASRASAKIIIWETMYMQK